MENTGEGTHDGERGGVVTARGTGEGLVIRLDGSVDPLELHDSLADFMTSRKSFLEGNEVALEWVGAMPEQAMIDSLSAFLSKEFSISVRESRFRDIKRAGESESAPMGDSSAAAGSAILSVRSFRAASSREGTSRRRAEGSEDFFDDRADARRRESGGRDGGQRQSHIPMRSEGLRSEGQAKKVSLFDGIDVMNIPDDNSPQHNRFSSEFSGKDRSRSGANQLLWDDPDARIVNMTLRSGQRVESDHSIIVRGDVNSGAEVIAGGDIIILGTLRGIAHAGAFDDTGGGRSIVALSLQPTQLRIGSLISRGKSEVSGGESGQGIEIARIEGNIIVVEPYQVQRGSRR